MSSSRPLAPLLFAFLSPLAAAACGGDGEAVTALFEVPRGPSLPSSFYALPFPNDIRVGADGTVDLSGHLRHSAVVDAFLDAIDERQRGFSIHAATFFRFSGPIDPSSLPATPEASLESGASVYLVDVDPDSPARGQRVPLRFRFEERAGQVIGENWLSILPFPGFPLRERTTYAAVVTRRVRAAGGGAVGRSSDFDAIAADGAGRDASLARARERYRPLWDWLAEPGGDEAGDVISAAVFTTQDATSLLGRVREVVHRDAAPPAPRDLALGGEEAAYAWYDGVYDAPVFQRGQVPYLTAAHGGDIEIDLLTGDPVLQRMDAFRFALAVPLGTAPASGWPVVIYSHGTGGSYHSFLGDGTADALARAGMASLSIDQVLHGPRNPAGSPELAFFNYQNPLSARDNTLQGALDCFQLVRLAADLEFTDASRTVRFDPERIFFFGHSQGGITGVPFVAHEPLVKGAVFSGAGGIFYLSLLHKTEPVDVAGLVRGIVGDDPLDEFNPVLALLQLWIDRADSASYGPLLIERPVAANGPKHVFHSLGLVDRYTPVPNIEALATSMRVHPVEPVLSAVPGLALAGRAPLAAPISGNVAGVTGVLTQYQAPPGSDGHFVLFDVPEARRQSVEFLRTLADTGAATLVAPSAVAPR